MATAEFTGAVILEADLELTASGTLDFNGNLSGDAGTESLTIVSVTDLTFAAAVHDLDTLAVQTADTITFESTLDDITTLDLTATSTRFEGDLTGLGGRPCPARPASPRRAAPWPPPSLPEPWCWKRIWN
ncbi:MAG: hypothetical protein R3C12_19335 [Planctomycetaceae bacterium]